MSTEVVSVRWGTWEELLLGGAVLRHGTRDWDLVSTELRARTLCPFIFTPQVCKAKYEDLQRRYSGCKALFEELRKQRMAELKKALEKSEDSIGSLESKLETLKARRRSDSNVGCDSSQTESVIPFQKSDGVESSSKEISKDGLSAGSFTLETRTNWSPKCQVPDSVSMEDIETKPEVSVSPKQENVLGIGNLAETFCIGQGRSIRRRRRGKRKRKGCSKDMKEGSVGDSDFWGSTDVLSATLCKDNSTSTSGQTGRCFVIEDKNRGSSNDEHADLVGIFDSIAENKCATVFSRRLDSQKRGRYKKTIVQHMDIDTLRSRISSHSITSLKEVFRDLLLLANNALVFYSKTTREYKSALQLREIVTKSLRRHLKDYISKTTITLLSTTPQMLHPTVKPRSARPANGKSLAKVTKAGNALAKTANAAKKTSNVHSAESLTMIKKGSGRPRKSGRGGAAKQPENPLKGRKRPRAR